MNKRIYSFGGLGNLFKCTSCGSAEFTLAKDVKPERFKVYECANCHEWYTQPANSQLERFDVQMLKALENVIEYLSGEKNDYEAQNEPDNHIYRDIEVLENYLKVLKPNKEPQK